MSRIFSFLVSLASTTHQENLIFVPDLESSNFTTQWIVRSFPSKTSDSSPGSPLPSSLAMCTSLIAPEAVALEFEFELSDPALWFVDRFVLFLPRLQASTTPSMSCLLY